MESGGNTKDGERIRVSVIVCTHNPSMDYFARTLAALRKQTFPRTLWELIVVDNGSADAVSERFDTSWHPRVKIISESRLGQIFARARGIDASVAPLLLFVDDDNELAPDYIATAEQYAENWPQIGVFCGSLHGEFEVPQAIAPRWHHLVAVDSLHEDYWSNNPEDYRAYPCGAGLVVRRDVAIRWRNLVRDDARRSRLSRQGANLAGGDDTDIVHTALSMRYGMGRFKDLVLTHLIPSRRIQPAYLVAIAAGHAWSDMWVRFLWGRKFPPFGVIRRVVSLVRAASQGRLALRVEFARQKAMHMALRTIVAEGVNANQCPSNGDVDRCRGATIC